MSGIFDQIINYSPPLIVSGTVNYKGTWNASTNNPPLSNPPVASTKGDYYVVSTAGTQFSLTFAVGDWIISSGTAWEKVDLTDAVSSVFGRTGAVVGVSTDYSSVGLTNTAIGASSPSTGAFTTLGSNSTTTLNGTTIPASSTLLVSGGALGTPSSGTLTSCTGLPISTGVSGLGTGVATALAVNVGSAGAPVVNGGALGTPSSGTVTNLTGTASININGTVGATTPSTVAATTVTASGAISTTQAAGGVFSALSGTTGYLAMVLQNTGGTSYFGIENSTGSVFNATPYAAVAYAPNEFDVIIGNVKKAAFTSTGLNSTAIGATTPSTGAFTTLSASGLITSTNSGRLFNRAGATTAEQYFQVANTGGDYFWGVNDSAAAFAGGTAYSSFRYVPTGRVIQDIVQGTAITTASSTGLAVTGALSSDSLVKIGGTVNGSSGLQFDVSRSLSGVEWFGSVSGAGYGHRAIEDDSGVGFSRFKLQGRVNSASWTTVLQVDGTTGLAVTGALSCTGALAIGNTVNTVSPTSPNRTVTIVIGGTTYYLAAKTTND